MSDYMRELDAAVFFFREAETARHSQVVAHVRDRSQELLKAIDAGTPVKTNGGGQALYFAPKDAEELLKAAAALRGAA